MKLFHQKDWVKFIASEFLDCLNARDLPCISLLATQSHCPTLHWKPPRTVLLLKLCFCPSFLLCWFFHTWPVSQPPTSSQEAPWNDLCTSPSQLTLTTVMIDSVIFPFWSSTWDTEDNFTTIHIRAQRSWFKFVPPCISLSLFCSLFCSLAKDAGDKFQKMKALCSHGEPFKIYVSPLISLGKWLNCFGKRGKNFSLLGSCMRAELDTKGLGKKFFNYIK